MSASFHRLGSQGLDDRLDFFHRAKSRTPQPPKWQKNRFLQHVISPVSHAQEAMYQTFRPNFFSNSASEIWIMVGRPWGQQ